MIDPVLGSVLFGIVGVSFLMGAYAASHRYPSRKSSDAARQTEGFRFRQSVVRTKIPALFVFFPIAVSSVLVYLFIGRAGGPPAPRVQLMELGGVLLFLATTVGGSTVVGSMVGAFLKKTIAE